MHPGIVGFSVLAHPGFIAGFAGSGDGVEAPDLFAGFGIPCSKETADAVLTAGDARDRLGLVTR
jgi:hypothetical protein